MKIVFYLSLLATTQWFLPWWFFAPEAFLFGWMTGLDRNSKQSLWLAVILTAILWIGAAILGDLGEKGKISDLLGQMSQLPGWTFYLLTGFIVAVPCFFSMLAGQKSRRIFT